MRPKLDKYILPETFQNYYWLKTDLIQFCRDNKLSTAGAKKELEERIIHFIKTGKKRVSNKQSNNNFQIETAITLKTRLKDAYKNDLTNRFFFKSIIGERFKFNVIFMKWVKLNPENTYQDAVNEWLRIESEKKSGKKHKIGPQFEYNQYTRDFFAANPNKKRTDAITCWKFKKNLPGTNKYEDLDLESLKY